MKIDNIKTGLKRASAVALAIVSMCPSMNAAKHREYEEESSSVVSNVISFVAGGVVVGAGFYFFGNKGTDSNSNNKVEGDMLGSLVSKAYKIYSEQTQNAGEKELIKAIYEYWMYSMSHAFDELELVGDNDNEIKASKEYELFNSLKILTEEEKKNIVEHIKTKGNSDLGGKGNTSYKKSQLSYAIDFLFENLIVHFNGETHTLKNSEALKFLKVLCDSDNNDIIDFRADPASKLTEFCQRLKAVK